MYDVRGDDLSAAFSKGSVAEGNAGDKPRFNESEVLERMQRISQRWSQALKLFEEGLASSASKHAEEELNTAKVVNACFKSACNMLRFYMMKKDGGVAEGQEYLDLQRQELENVLAVVSIVKADKRQGFHSEAQVYMFDAKMLEDKIEKLKKLLKE